jgi:uncharacterized paraquat-inducible protein A
MRIKLEKKRTHCINCGKILDDRNKKRCKRCQEEFEKMYPRNIEGRITSY